MRANLKRSMAFGCSVAVVASSIFGSGIPKPLRSRFVIGDPVWRELPIRDEFRSQYERCWQTAVNTILENHFDIATMDKESGDLRTSWSEGAFALYGNWAYKVQVNLQMVYVPADPRADPGVPGMVQKIRIQVAGELWDIDVRSGKTAAAFRGYDQLLLENLFEDLEGKLGAR